LEGVFSTKKKSEYSQPAREEGWAISDFLYGKVGFYEHTESTQNFEARMGCPAMKRDQQLQRRSILA
jgi:hypothetical protein